MERSGKGSAFLTLFSPSPPPTCGLNVVLLGRAFRIAHIQRITSPRRGSCHFALGYQMIRMSPGKTSTTDALQERACCVWMNRGFHANEPTRQRGTEAASAVKYGTQDISLSHSVPEHSHLIGIRHPGTLSH